MFITTTKRREVKLLENAASKKKTKNEYQDLVFYFNCSASNCRHTRLGYIFQPRANEQYCTGKKCAQAAPNEHTSTKLENVLVPYVLDAALNQYIDWTLPGCCFHKKKKKREHDHQARKISHSFVVVNT